MHLKHYCCVTYVTYDVTYVYIYVLRICSFYCFLQNIIKTNNLTFQNIVNNILMILIEFQDVHASLNPDLQGLIPRAFGYLFYLLHNNPGVGFRMTASYLEIYNEQVYMLCCL